MGPGPALGPRRWTLNCWRCLLEVKHILKAQQKSHNTTQNNTHPTASSKRKRQEDAWYGGRTYKIFRTPSFEICSYIFTPQPTQPGTERRTDPCSKRSLHDVGKSSLSQLDTGNCHMYSDPANRRSPWWKYIRKCIWRSLRNQNGEWGRTQGIWCIKWLKIHATTTKSGIPFKWLKIHDKIWDSFHTFTSESWHGRNGTNQWRFKLGRIFAVVGSLVYLLQWGNSRWLWIWSNCMYYYVCNACACEQFLQAELRLSCGGSLLPTTMHFLNPMMWLSKPWTTTA